MPIGAQDAAIQVFPELQRAGSLGHVFEAAGANRAARTYPDLDKTEKTDCASRSCSISHLKFSSLANTFFPDFGRFIGFVFHKPFKELATQRFCGIDCYGVPYLPDPLFPIPGENVIVRKTLGSGELVRLQHPEPDIEDRAQLG
ncbi:MAG: hypothetical protein ACREAC_05725, partial [Blastocatellia bacterium]